MSETTNEMEPIRVTLPRDRIADMIYQQLEDDVGDAEDIHARHAIDFAIRALDELGLIVRS